MVAVACRSAPVQKTPVSGTDLRWDTQMTEKQESPRRKIPTVDGQIITRIKPVQTADNGDRWNYKIIFHLLYRVMDENCVASA